LNRQKNAEKEKAEPYFRLRRGGFILVVLFRRLKRLLLTSPRLLK